MNIVRVELKSFLQFHQPLFIDINASNNSHPWKLLKTLQRSYNYFTDSKYTDHSHPHHQNIMSIFAHLYILPPSQFNNSVFFHYRI